MSAVGGNRTSRIVHARLPRRVGRRLPAVSHPRIQDRHGSNTRSGAVVPPGQPVVTLDVSGRLSMPSAARTASEETLTISLS
jgi:hypothetical protein